MKINWEAVCGFLVLATIVVAIGAGIVKNYGLSLSMMMAAIFCQGVENWFAIKRIERRLG